MVETFDCNNTNLKKGSKGSKVSLLQTHLKTLGYYTTSGKYTLKVDGSYGTYTVSAVKKFQKDTGHTQDGVFGAKTCKSLNEKILAKNGITTNNNNSTNTTKTNTNKNSTAPIVQIDKSKSPYTFYQGNLHIEGLHFIANKVTPNQEFNNGNWKTIELMNNKNYVYQGRPLPKKYSVEMYLTNERYDKCKTELAKLGGLRCKVASDVLDAGYYYISVSVANENYYEKKVTLELTQDI